MKLEYFSKPGERFVTTGKKVSGLRFPEQESVRSSWALPGQLTTENHRIGAKAAFGNRRDQASVGAIMQTLQKFLDRCLQQSILLALFKV
jgi:hypothetical protein